MVDCDASVKGEMVKLNFDQNGHWSGPNPWLNEEYTYREWIFGGGGATECPSAITLAHLAPDFLPTERAKLCLVWDDELETYTAFADGERNAYGICKDPRTFCERAADLKDEAKVALGVGTTAAAGAGGAAVVANAAGVTAVTHSSGAAILTGSSGYVAGSLGSVGATALSTVGSVVTAPVTIAVGVVSIAAIGGTTYMCWDDLQTEKEE